MARPFVLSNARVANGSIRDLAVADGCIVNPEHTALGSAIHISLPNCIILPGLIDSHSHLDKTLLGGPWLPHRAGDSVIERIDNERRARPALRSGLRDRAEALLCLAVSNGTTALRTHIDIDDEVGLANLVAVLELREAWRGRVEIQIVAFPQSGIRRRTGVDELLDEALSLGADLIGGIDPVAIDGDRDGHLQVVFDLASKHAKGVDIHLHEMGEAGVASLMRIVELTAANGLAGRVAVSHAFCLGSVEHSSAAKAADALGRAGVAVITCAPGTFPMPPVELLRSAGVRVAAGSDNVRDLWSPFGNANMLERCMLVAYRSGWRTDEALLRSLDLATTEAAAVLGMDGHRLEVGMPATCAVFPVSHVPLAIVERPRPRLVLSGGHPIHDPERLLRQH
jgi:cytosine/creatinine deaminase